MMTGWAEHLIILPILLPLVAAMVMLLHQRTAPHHQASIGIAATFAVLVISTLLLRQADAKDAAPTSWRCISSGTGPRRSGSCSSPTDWRR